MKGLNHVILKIAEMDFFVSWEAGPKVLRNAQRIDKTKISKVCFHGKNSFVWRLRNKSYWMTIVMPTKTPIMIPKRLEAKTRRSAS